MTRFLPFIVFLVGVITLGLSGAPEERGFWPILIVALALGLMLAKEKRRYADAALTGAAQPIVMLMLFAWMLAGILAELLQASGVVDALVQAAGSLQLGGSGFVVLAFLVTAAVSTATGTSLGTLLLCTPLLYPAGGSLGASPTVLIGAILAGATFGDNISPVSDTTIASATTQRAEMGRVVRSRLRYAIPAALISIVVFALFGGSGSVDAESAVDLKPLLMMLSPAVVIALLLCGRHLLEGLFAGIAAAIVLGLLLGLLEPAQLFHIDRDAFGARGLLVAGIERAVGVSIFTLLLMALVGAMELGPLFSAWLERRQEQSEEPRRAEGWIVAVTSVVVLTTTHAVVAILTVGDWTRQLGERAGIGAARRANLLDLTVSTYPFLLPWFIPTILAAALTRDAAGVPALSVVQVGWWNVHSWALLAITLIAVATGWGRAKD